MRQIILCYCAGSHIVRQIYCEGYLSFASLKDLKASLAKGSFGQNPEFVFIDVISSFSGTKNSFLDNISLMDDFLGYPVAIGGNIRTLDDIDLAMRESAERVVLNTCLEQNFDVLQQSVETHGGQSILPLIDVVEINGNETILINGAREQSKRKLVATLQTIKDLNIHELIIRFVETQGTPKPVNKRILDIVYENWSGNMITTGGKLEFLRDKNHVHVNSLKFLP